MTPSMLVPANLPIHPGLREEKDEKTADNRGLTTETNPTD